MVKELDKLLNFIEQEYLEFNRQWKNSKYYSKINLKKKTICDLKKENTILNLVFNYREFINENNMQLIIDFMHFNTDKNTLNVRTKTRNSIEYKTENYIRNHNDGEIPINKCFNDLFGLRMISKKKMEKEQITNLIDKKYKNIKCIDSTKGDYKAIHIYFKEDNFSFPWELQIWEKSNELNNILSHEKYKQDYISWENKNKGGK